MRLAGRQDEGRNVPDFIWIILGVLGGIVALWYLIVLVAAIWLLIKKD